MGTCKSCTKPIFSGRYPKIFDIYCTCNQPKNDKEQIKMPLDGLDCKNVEYQGGGFYTCNINEFEPKII